NGEQRSSFRKFAVAAKSFSTQWADTVEKLQFSRKRVKNLPVEGLSENSSRGSAKDQHWQCLRLSGAPLGT
ncbi:MAG: hypothetical protein ABJ364_08450, partial [Lentilitoribacter sp.]